MVWQQMTLMYAAVNFIQSRSPYGQIDGQPNQAPASYPPPTSGPNTAVAPHAVSPQPNGELSSPPQPQPQQQASGPSQQSPGSPPPDAPDDFNAALHELAQSLVLQEQQIEYLINSLPGLGNSEESQTRRMRELEAELRQVEQERARAEEVKERMVDVVGEVLAGIKRVP